MNKLLELIYTWMGLVCFFLAVFYPDAISDPRSILLGTAATAFLAHARQYRLEEQIKVLKRKLHIGGADDATNKF